MLALKKSGALRSITDASHKSSDTYRVEYRSPVMNLARRARLQAPGFKLLLDRRQLFAPARIRVQRLEVGRVLEMLAQGPKWQLAFRLLL
jgi:hypothetical protein